MTTDPTPPSTASGGGLSAAATLWCCHIAGPDDVYPAPDQQTAWIWADQMNGWLARRVNVPDVMCHATAQPWLWSPEAHAAGLDKAIREGTSPAVVAHLALAATSTDAAAGWADGGGAQWTMDTLPPATFDAMVEHVRVAMRAAVDGEGDPALVAENTVAHWFRRMSASPVDGEALWEALKRGCCATKPEDGHWPKISTIVQVRKTDVLAAPSQLSSSGETEASSHCRSLGDDH